MREIPTITTEQIQQMDALQAFRFAEDLFDDRFPRHAARVLDTVVQENPDHAAAWELLGRSHFAAAHLGPAEEAFRRLIELEPTSGWAHTALGLTLDRQSRHREGATMHRLAAALGQTARDHGRVELLDSPEQRDQVPPIVLDPDDGTVD